MPNLKIDEIPTASSLTGEELAYVTQGGNSRRMAAKNVARPGIHRGPTAPSNPDINDLWATLTVVPPTPLYATNTSSGVPTVEFEGQTYEPLPAVTNLLTAPFDQTNPAYELFPPEGVQITSGSWPVPRSR